MPPVFQKTQCQKRLGPIAQLDVRPTCSQEVLDLILRSGTILSLRLIMEFLYGHSLPSAVSRRAAVSYWRKNGHQVLVNRLVGLSLPRKSVVRLTDHSDMIIAVDRGR